MKRSRLWKILRMEFRLTAANKAFVILTIVGPFLIVAVTILPGVISIKGARVAVANADPLFLDGLRAPLAQSGIRVIEARGSAETLDAELLAGSFDGYIILPEGLAAATRIQYVSKNVSDLQVTGVLQAVIGQSIVALRLIDAGLPSERIALLTRPPVLETRQLAVSGRKQGAGLPHGPDDRGHPRDAAVRDRAALRPDHRPVRPEREDLEDRGDHALLGAAPGAAVRQDPRQGRREPPAVRRLGLDDDPFSQGRWGRGSA